MRTALDIYYREMHPAIRNEIIRQKNKWGEQSHDPFTWIAIVLEEFGEATKDILDATHQNTSDEVHNETWNNARKEIVETIACLVQLYRSMEG